MFPILSRNQIKFIRTLKQKKYRYKFKNYVVEGEKLVADILQHRPELMEYVVIDDSGEFNREAIPGKTYQTDSRTFKLLSNMVQPQGVLAVCKMPDSFFSTNWQADAFTLYFDGIQDPGNLGTMLRTAEWFGIKQVLVGQGTVDPFGPKTVQAAMGSHTFLHLFQSQPSQHDDWPHPVILADLHGENAYDHQWDLGGTLVLGNEGQGISSELDALHAIRLTIPASEGSRSESLNVSMACTVLLTIRQKNIMNP